jgi:hypothetical protein
VWRALALSGEGVFDLHVLAWSFFFCYFNGKGDFLPRMLW